MAHNRGKKIGGSFLSQHPKKANIARMAVRTFVYEQIHLDGNIDSLNKNSINLVMNHFQIHETDRNKIKYIIREILKRNINLPPIVNNEPKKNYDRSLLRLDDKSLIIIKQSPPTKRSKMKAIMPPTSE